MNAWGSSHDQLQSTLPTFVASVKRLELVTLRGASFVATRAVPIRAQEGFSHAARISRPTTYYCYSILMENLRPFPTSVFEAPQILTRLKRTEYASAYKQHQKRQSLAVARQNCGAPCARGQATESFCGAAISEALLRRNILQLLVR
jgi:hypothetical protein